MTSHTQGDPAREEREAARRKVGEQLFRRVVALTDEVLGIDLNLSDEPCALSLAAMGAPSIVELLVRAGRFLVDVAAHYEEVLDERWPATGSEHRRGSSDFPAEEIADLAALGRSEVGRCRQRLESAIAHDDPLRVVAMAGEALRRLASALQPLEAAIGRHEKLEAPARVRWDLDIALMTRKLYATLRYDLDIDRPAPQSDLPARLAHCVTRLRELRSHELYRFLRFEDRIQMSNLLKRVSAWLWEGAQAAPGEARSLWQELRNLIELMRQVNNRPELKEHDRQVVVRACNQLLAGSSRPGRMPAYVREDLDNLLGLDDELDVLLRSGAEPPTSAWQPCLERLRVAFG